MKPDIGAFVVALCIVLLGVLMALALRMAGLPWCTWRAQVWGVC